MFVKEIPKHLFFTGAEDSGFPQNDTYLCSFVFHTGGVGSVGVPGPLACEVRTRDSVQGRCPPDGTGTPDL